MGRAVLLGCLPWLALLLVSFACIWLLMRINRTAVRWGRLGGLHGDQVGSVQSLSFVLTLPFFVMIMLFIVQVSQLMIATIVVQYAAYAAARSASVWIPADMLPGEGPNCISTYGTDPDAPEQTMPILDPGDPNYGPAQGGLTYLVEPGSRKHDKITSAAVIACMPICPSRDLATGLSPQGSRMAGIVQAAYGALVADSGSNAMIPVRLRNKLAYSMENTQVEVRFFHKNAEPPLATYFLPDDPGQFYFNELGWQDLITVTVRHKLALLPGPGRLLARRATGPDDPTDETSETIEQSPYVYVYPLKASVAMGNEGEIPVIPYAHN